MTVSVASTDTSVNATDGQSGTAQEDDPTAADVSLEDHAPEPSRKGRNYVSPATWKLFWDEVRARSRLEDILGTPDERRSDDDWWYCSPFRSEKTPSFHITRSKQLWKDFGGGVGKGGDVFDLVQRRDQLASPYEALLKLAERCGLRPPTRTPATEEERKVIHERQLMEDVLTDAAVAYHRALTPEHRAFLRSNYGFSDALIDEEQVGYDPGKLYLWDCLKSLSTDITGEHGQVVRTPKYDDETLYMTGLFVEGTTYAGQSRFHHRFTFPYRYRDKAVYFCARATKETPKYIKRKKGVVLKNEDGSEKTVDAPKYLKLKVRPDDLTPHEDSDAPLEWLQHSSISKTITNDWFAGEDFGGRQHALLVIAEGMPDYLAVKQAGYPCISPVTTCFRDQDAAKLIRLCKGVRTIVLVPDQERNGAGMAGAAKTVMILCQAGLDARVAVLPLGAAIEAKIQANAEKAAAAKALGEDVREDDLADWKIDACEFLRDNGKEAFDKAIKDAPRFIDALIEELPSTIHPDDLDRSLRPILSLVAAKPDAAREGYVSAIDDHLGEGMKRLLNRILAEEVAKRVDAKVVETAVEGDVHLTDLGNARRLVAKHKGAFLYAQDLDSFFVWSGKHWMRDPKGLRVRRHAEDVIRDLRREATAAEDKDTREALLTHAHRSESRSSIESMVELSKGQHGILLATSARLDAHPNLFNTQNGTVDLATGTLLPHNPKHLLTQLCPYPYEPDAKCPEWERALARSHPDPEIQAYIQRREGSYLSGTIGGNVLEIHWGLPNTGRSTHFETLHSVIGDDFVTKAPRSLFEKQRNESHPTDLMTVKSKRLVYGAEIKEHIDTEKLKELTGKDRITAHLMGKDNVTFAPTHKMSMYSNKKPVIRVDPTDGMIRRVVLVPWEQVIPDKESIRDLDKKFLAEAAGILAWLVRGCLAWQKQGLSPPAAIQAATHAYLEEQDDFRQFLAEVCESADPKNATDTVLAEDLWNCRKEWNEERNQSKHETKNSFGRTLTARGFQRGPLAGAKRHSTWLGIRLRQPANTDPAMVRNGESITEQEIEDVLKQANERGAPHLHLVPDPPDPGFEPQLPLPPADEGDHLAVYDRLDVSDQPDTFIARVRTIEGRAAFAIIGAPLKPKIESFIAGRVPVIASVTHVPRPDGQGQYAKVIRTRLYEASA